ncbi:hypothetical protein BGX33_008906 [Mortierella sp. NVP41]|nr:hypothetical protein BGX33_008906 [Mortierella sp. NVP41]
MSATKQVLEMPEIVRLIGLCVPLLSRYYDRFGLECFKFAPTTLLNCCLVSKSWRAILLPALWRFYDQTCMEADVPRHILARYRSHFRYYSGQVTSFTTAVEEEEDKEGQDTEAGTDVALCGGPSSSGDPIDPTPPQHQLQEKECLNLLRIEVRFDVGLPEEIRMPQDVFEPEFDYIGLLQANRRLRSIALSASEYNRQSLAVSALTNCTQLEVLTVMNFDTSTALLTSDLGRFLSPVSNTLTDLMLSNVQGQFDPTTVWLPYVISLGVTLSPDISPGIEELVARCPNVDQLVLFASDPMMNTDRMAAVLKNNCSRISNLRFVATLSDASELSKVIGACQGPLRRLAFWTPQLTDEILEAMRKHRSTLETLDMAVRFYKEEPVDFEDDVEVGAAALVAEQMQILREVVDSFLSLKGFLFCDERDRMSEADFFDGLMVKPWKCVRLQSLRLGAGTCDVSMRETLVPGKDLGLNWSISKGVSSVWDVPRRDYVLLERFLQHVSPLPRLRFVEAVHVPCYRAIDSRS